MEQTDYDDDVYNAWVQSAPTRRLVRLNESRLATSQLKLESAASRSEDAEVREAVAELRAVRVILAEIRKQDAVGAQQ